MKDMMMSEKEMQAMMKKEIASAKMMMKREDMANTKMAKKKKHGMKD